MPKLAASARPADKYSPLQRHLVDMAQNAILRCIKAVTNQSAIFQYTVGDLHALLRQ
jgi:hypothetical protein